MPMSVIWFVKIVHLPMVPTEYPLVMALRETMCFAFNLLTNFLSIMSEYAITNKLLLPHFCIYFLSRPSLSSPLLLWLSFHWPPSELHCHWQTLPLCSRYSLDHFNQFFLVIPCLYSMLSLENLMLTKCVSYFVY